MSTDSKDLHKTVNTIKKLLTEKHMWFDYIEHAPVRTSEEAANIRPDYTMAQGAKALIVRIKKSNTEKFFAMLVVPGNTKFDVNKTKALFEAKDIRFATQEEIAAITDGILIGGIPPLGNLFRLEVYVDKKLADQKIIVFNAGDRRVSIAIKYEDYFSCVHPKIVDIT